MTLPVRVLIQGRHFLKSDVWNVQIDAEDEGAPEMKSGGIINISNLGESLVGQYYAKDE